MLTEDASLNHERRENKIKREKTPLPTNCGDSQKTTDWRHALIITGDLVSQAMDSTYCNRLLFGEMPLLRTTREIQLCTIGRIFERSTDSSMQRTGSYVCTHTLLQTEPCNTCTDIKKLLFAFSTNEKHAFT